MAVNASAGKTLPELYRFYRTNLLSELMELDRQRRAVLNRLLTVAGAVLLPVVIPVWGWLSLGWHEAFAIAAAVCAALATWLLIRKQWQRYRTRFKQRIIRSIIRFIDEDLAYQADGCLPQSLFHTCGIFRKRIDHYSGDDLVRGTIGRTDVEFGEIHAQYKTEHTDSKGNHRTEWHTIFKGLFFSADFHKHFAGSTFVLTDRAEKLLGFMGAKLQSFDKTYGELVRLENPAFEKRFAAYANDQIEARYILTPAMMERMVAFQDKSGRNIQFAFVASRVYVAIPYSKDLFEPRLFGHIIAFKLIKEYFEDLQLALGIVEDLNLNTRIWSKM